MSFFSNNFFEGPMQKFLNEAEKPWILVTVRRTGGTNLATFMNRLSSFRTIQHEPFNSGRKYGEITDQFISSRDIHSLNSAIVEVLDQKINIKHCFDTVPAEVTQALLSAAIKRNYRIVILTRKDEVARLLSLGAAKATGVWTKKAASEKYPSIVLGSGQVRSIDISYLLRTANVTTRNIGLILTLLRNHNSPYLWVLFEDLYTKNTEKEKTAMMIADFVGIDRQKVQYQLEWFMELQSQNTKEVLPHFPNVREVREKLSRLFPLYH